MIMLTFNFKCALSVPSRLNALLDVVLFTDDFPLEETTTVSIRPCNGLTTVR